MSGTMRRRVPASSRAQRSMFQPFNSFHAPQKDNSVRQKRRAGFNNYTDQTHQEAMEAKETTKTPEETLKLKAKRQRRKARKKKRK